MRRGGRVRSLLSGGSRLERGAVQDAQTLGQQQPHWRRAYLKCKIYPHPGTAESISTF